MNHEVQEEQARDAMRAWLAEFAPLVMDQSQRTATEIRQELNLIERLQERTDQLDQGKGLLTRMEDGELIRTYNQAREQIRTIERDLRRRLATLAPGDPNSEPDYSALQERLAETAAQIEVGVPTISANPDRLELVSSPAQVAAGIGMGIFGLGWTAFTTLHAFFMIGGMLKAMGPVAFAMLGFYAIFWAVGVGMFMSAFNLAAQETIALEGDTLTITKTLGPIRRAKQHRINPKLQVRIGTTEKQVSHGRGRSVPVKVAAIIFTGEDGRPIAVATGTTDANREVMLRQIQAHLGQEDTSPVPPPVQA
ncbi:MAG: hypothetical protein Fur0036_01740 [Fimbriimonadaceae bacterium]